MFPKTPVAISTISSALNRKNILFASLSADDIQRVIERMEPLAVPAGTTIIRQGDDATDFYVVQSGVLDVFVDGTKVFRVTTTSLLLVTSLRAVATARVVGGWGVWWSGKGSTMKPQA